MPSLILYPNGQGDATQLRVFSTYCSGSNFNYVISDQDNCMVYANSQNGWHYDLYHFEDLTATGIITGVTVFFKCQLADTTCTKKVFPKIKTNGIEIDGIQIQPAYGNGAPSSSTWYNETWSINPVTGLSWTWAEIINLQAGIAIESICNNGIDPRCDVMYLLIDYEISDLCSWIDSKGGGTGLDITEVFQIIDSYIFQSPPAGYTFIPTVTQVMGIIDYYLGFIDSGNNKTGCIY